MKEFFKRFRAQLWAYLFSFLVTTVGRILVTALILRYWSTGAAGLWLSISSVSYFALLLDGGVSRYFSNEAISRYAANDHEGAQAFYSCARLFSYGIAIVMLVCGAFLCAVFDVRNLVGGVEEVSRFQASFAFLGVITASAFVLVGVNQQIPLRVHGREAEAILWENISRLAEILWVGLCAIFRGNLADAGIGIAVCRVSINLLVVYRSPRLISGSKRKINLSEPIQLLKQHIRKASAYLLLPAADLISLNLTPVIVGMIFGPAALAEFTVVRIYSRLLWQLPQWFRMSVVNELSRCHGRGDNETAMQLLHRMTILSLIGMSAGSLFLMFIREPFFHAWLGAQSMVPDMGVMGLFLFAAFCSGLTLLPSVVLESRNHHEKYCFLKLFGALVGLLAFLAIANWCNAYTFAIVGIGLADLGVYLLSQRMLKTRIRSVKTKVA